MDAVTAAASRVAVGLTHAALGARLSILIFHRVRAQPDPLFPTEPDARRFERLMRLIGKSFTVLPLGRAVSQIAGGDLPPRSLVITFDDGYRDNAEIALPILARHGLVASFFVTTGFLDGGRMWNDSLIESVRTSPVNELDLGFLGLGRRPLTNLPDRRAAIDTLLARIKYLGPHERNAAVSRVQDLCRVRDLPDCLMMEAEHVRAVHRAGMEIGAHTVSHPILTALRTHEAEQEIATGRRRLEEIIDAPVDLFAYPNGKPCRDFDQTHVDIVRRLGFRGAVSTAQGVARPGDDVFQLPRFTPWGAPLWKWAAQLTLNQSRTRYATTVAS